MRLGKTYIDIYLLALAPERYHLDRAVGKEAACLVDIEQRRALDGYLLSHLTHTWHKSHHIGRRVLQTHTTSLADTAVGVDDDSREMLIAPLEVLLSRGGNDIDIRYAEAAEVFPDHICQHLIPLQCYHVREAAAQLDSIASQATGHIQQALATERLCRSTRLRRGLLHRAVGEDTTCGIERRVLEATTLEVLHLRSHNTSLHNPRIEGYGGGLAVDIALDG